MLTTAWLDNIVYRPTSVCRARLRLCAFSPLVQAYPTVAHHTCLSLIAKLVLNIVKILVFGKITHAWVTNN